MSVFIVGTIDFLLWHVCAFGIPGNILSAIVWLRRRQNSSAIYLAALAINDLFILLIRLGGLVIPFYVEHRHRHYWLPVNYLLDFTQHLEPLLILGFSVERLFVILRPFQVSFFSFIDVCY